MAYKFEDKFVHFRWDDSLKGKKVFYADSISQLEEDVAEGEDIKTLIGANEHSTTPFIIEEEDGMSADWKFVYYDPNYEVKLAFEKGMVIQYRAKDKGDWCDWNNSLGKCPFLDALEYRIKPTTEAYVILGQVDDVPKLFWNFDKEIKKESRPIYFRGTLDECVDYIEEHKRFAPVMKAWEEGKKIQFSSSVDEWEDVKTPAWSTMIDYRVKPEEDNDEKVLKWTDLKVGDVITDGKTTAMVVVSSPESHPHIFIGYKWITDVELKNWKKVKND